MNIENKRQIAILLLAVILGIIAAVLTGSTIESNIKQATSQYAADYQKKQIKPLVDKVVAMEREIRRLQAMKQAPAPVIKESAPKVPKIPKSSLALRTPVGRRAYTVRIDSLSAVGGLINPGDYVDIIGHLAMPDPVTFQKQNISSIIFQNIQILAVDTNLQAPGSYERQQARALNVTFALTPEEAGLMSFVERNGKMQLILRAPAEMETETVQVATWEELAGYVYDKQGTELMLPRKEAPLKIDETPAGIEPYIEIFQGGQAL